MSVLELQAYLAASETIDFYQPEVAARAEQLAAGKRSAAAIAAACFEFVRDQISHSWDARQNPVTCNASEVLRHGTGYCYAKSHLLAALLRANGIPAALCYQKLLIDGPGEFCLHGLNAVLLPDLGWYRIDARGNKPGVDAAFCPPREQLAFPVRDPGETDYPDLYAEPHPAILALLRNNASVEQVYQQLSSVFRQPWQTLSELSEQIQLNQLSQLNRQTAATAGRLTD